MRSGSQDHELTLTTLHHSLTDPALESMNFLNEVASRYPEAVSFASGRPTEEFFDVKLIHDYIDTYCCYLKNDRGFSDAEVNQALFQYGRTKGIAAELIARELSRDEGIDIYPAAIHFYSDHGGLPHVRLAFSQLTPDLIETGLDRFAAFVAGQRARS